MNDPFTGSQSHLEYLKYDRKSAEVVSDSDQSRRSVEQSFKYNVGYISSRNSGAYDSYENNQIDCSIKAGIRTDYVVSKLNNTNRIYPPDKSLWDSNAPVTPAPPPYSRRSPYAEKASKILYDLGSKPQNKTLFSETQNKHLYSIPNQPPYVGKQNNKNKDYNNRPHPLYNNPLSQHNLYNNNNGFCSFEKSFRDADKNEARNEYETLLRDKSYLRREYENENNVRDFSGSTNNSELSEIIRKVNDIYYQSLQSAKLDNTSNTSITRFSSDFRVSRESLLDHSIRKVSNLRPQSQTPPSFHSSSICGLDTSSARLTPSSLNSQQNFRFRPISEGSNMMDNVNHNNNYSGTPKRYRSAEEYHYDYRGGFLPNESNRG